MFDFSCVKCDFSEEYGTSKSLPKSLQAPKICPNCGAKLKKDFQKESPLFDVVGGYEYEYGKKSRYYKDPKFKADVLSNDNIKPY